ncbi:MAG: DUF707 domain-containing protein [Acidocella sp.]|nr:DUF707 domain-containing protein [Acidocella sp.]
MQQFEMINPNFIHALRTGFGSYVCYDLTQNILYHLEPELITGSEYLICLRFNKWREPEIFCTSGSVEIASCNIFRQFEVAVEQSGPHHISLKTPSGYISAHNDRQFSFDAAIVSESETFQPEQQAFVRAYAGIKKRPPSRFAIFTAAGDNHNVKSWMAQAELRQFDLIIVYYGDHPETADQLKSMADVFIEDNGSKWQILKRLYGSQPRLFSAYDYILVSDDDLIWSTLDINRAFSLAKDFDLWVCQPAFDPAGKVSFTLNLAQPGAHTLRYTNYVETTCPIFHERKLAEFMQIYDGKLAGWGVDFWFMHVFGHGANFKVAVLDAVVTLNPHDATKADGLREIDKLQSATDRERDWLDTAKRYNIERRVQRTFGWVTLDPFAIATKKNF